jgi:hypothetical protein
MNANGEDPRAAIQGFCGGAKIVLSDQLRENRPSGQHN